MGNTRLHIIALDNPSPPDYGGAIDMYWRIKALAEAGVKITLHIFYKNRRPGKEWDEVCEKVHGYRRKVGWNSFTLKLPYLVYSRRSRKLLRALSQDDAPILFEGLHTCFYLDHPLLKNRLKMVRLHNIEHAYYSDLAKNSSGIKSLYFRIEADLLARFERTLKHADVLFPISHKETRHFEAVHSRVKYLPPFFDTALELTAPTTTKPFCLYHGNLSVSENEAAVEFLITQVFSQLKTLLVVAGKLPTARIKKLCAKYTHVNLVANPSFEKLKSLLNTARIHVLYSNQETGIKLKLLESLKHRGHIVISPSLNDGDIFTTVCEEAANSEAYITLLKNRLDSEISEEQWSARKQFLEQHFNPKNSAQLILKEITALPM